MPTSSAKHDATNIARIATPTQDINEAGPAIAAAIPGTKNIPVPIIALIARRINTLNEMLFFSSGVLDSATLF